MLSPDVWMESQQERGPRFGVSVSEEKRIYDVHSLFGNEGSVI